MRRCDPSGTARLSRAVALPENFHGHPARRFARYFPSYISESEQTPPPSNPNFAAFCPRPPCVGHRSIPETQSANSLQLFSSIEAATHRKCPRLRRQCSARAAPATPPPPSTSPPPPLILSI